MEPGDGPAYWIWALWPPTVAVTSRGFLDALILDHHLRGRLAGDFIGHNHRRLARGGVNDGRGDASATAHAVIIRTWCDSFRQPSWRLP